jgi:hypothetical protein
MTRLSLVERLLKDLAAAEVLVAGLTGVRSVENSIQIRYHHQGPRDR